MKQHNQHQQNEKRNVRIAGAAVCVFLFGAALFSGACSAGEHGKESVTNSPTVTEKLTPAAKPRNWMLRMLAEGRTELSTHISPLLEEGAQIPVSISKTVRLDDFECIMTVPQSSFRLSDLQNGTAEFEATSILRYVGEKESVKISCRNTTFVTSVTDPSGNTESSGRYDEERDIVLKKGDEIFLRKIYGDLSMNVESTGAGVITTEIEFTILSENEEGKGEHWEYLLVIPFDVVE